MPRPPAVLDSVAATIQQGAAEGSRRRGDRIDQATRSLSLKIHVTVCPSASRPLSAFVAVAVARVEGQKMRGEVASSQGWPLAGPPSGDTVMGGSRCQQGKRSELFPEHDADQTADLASSTRPSVINRVHCGFIIQWNQRFNRLVFHQVQTMVQVYRTP